MSEDSGAEEGEGAPEEGGEQKKRLSGKKLILFIVLPVLLLVGAGVGLYFSGIFASKPPVEAQDEEQKEKPPPKPTVQQRQSVFLDLPDQIVNLNSRQQRRAVFLKISISLELDGPEDIPIVNQVMPRIIDNFQIYLRELRVEDLQGSAGMYRLREELLRRVSLASRPARVRDVLFKEMLVQ